MKRSRMNALVLAGDPGLPITEASIVVLSLTLLAVVGWLYLLYR